MRTKVLESFVIALRVALAALFIVSGILKSHAPVQFINDIQGYKLLPYRGVVALALFLPWLEIFAGAGLLIRQLRAGAVTILLASMLIFIAAISSAAWRGLDISCGCFGESVHTANYPWLIGRDIVILVGLSVIARGAWTRTPEISPRA